MKNLKRKIQDTFHAYPEIVVGASTAVVVGLVVGFATRRYYSQFLDDYVLAFDQAGLERLIEGKRAIITFDTENPVRLILHVQDNPCS